MNPLGGQATDADQRPSIGEMLTEISGDLSTLMSQEIALAKAEVRQSAIRGGKGAGMLAGAGVSSHMVSLFLSVAAWWRLGETIGRGWSALIVAAVWLLIGTVLALIGKREIDAVTGTAQTAETMKKIPSAVAGNEENR